MKHASSRELFRYWTTLRGQRPAPERGEVDPVALRRVLGDSFILSAEPACGHVIRLAGTRMCALFCRELKAEPFLRLWAPESRALVHSLVDIVTVELTAVVAGAHGRPRSESPVPLELLLLPLAPGTTRHARLIGVLAPLLPAYWIGISPVEALTLGAFRHIEPTAADAFTPRAVVPTYQANPPRYPSTRLGPPRFIVYEGGAAASSAGADSLPDQ